jgi:hypothetical protein
MELPFELLLYADSCHFRPARPPGAMYRKFKPPAF